MRIRLSQPALLPELLSFLRRAGCIAYYVPDAEELEALLLHRFGAAESRELRALLERWQQRHPDAPAEAWEA